MAGPSDTVDHLTQAINRGDLETALALYETNAVLVVQPGRLACGTTQLREALARFIALEPTLRSEAQEVIAAGDLALYAGQVGGAGGDRGRRPCTLRGPLDPARQGSERSPRRHERRILSHLTPAARRALANRAP